MSKQQTPSGFKDLLTSMMARRWYITALVLGGFMLIIGGMFAAIGVYLLQVELFLTMHLDQHLMY
jgi:hypothetical protein